MRVVIGLVCASLLFACGGKTPEEHLQEALSRIAAGEPRVAIIELKNGLQQDPQNGQMRAVLGNVYYDLGQYPDAESELRKAIDAGTDDESTRLNWLRTKLQLGSHAEIIGELEGRDDLSPEAAAILGLAYLNGEDPVKAQPMLEQGAGTADGQIGLAQLAYDNGDLANAIEHLDKAVDLNPEYGQAWLMKGEAQITLQNFADAAVAFERAAELPASSFLGNLGLARVHLINNETEQAQSVINRVLQQAPEFVPAQYLSAVASEQAGDVDAVEAALTDVLRVAPNHPPSLYLMGVTKLRKNQTAQSARSAVALLEPRPGKQLRPESPSEYRRASVGVGRRGRDLGARCRDGQRSSATRNVRHGLFAPWPRSGRGSSAAACGGNSSGRCRTSEPAGPESRCEWR